MNAAVKSVYWWSRIALGLVWIYEGVVPKLLWVHDLPVQIAVVERSGLYLNSPVATLIALGVAQTALGLALLIGWRARAMSVLATVWMLVLIVLVGVNKPDMWIDPFGAFAKDLCLAACAFTVWRLHNQTTAFDGKMPHRGGHSLPYEKGLQRLP